MGQFQTLAIGGKNHAVIADHVTAPERSKADGAARPCTGNAIAPALGDIIQLNAPALGNRAAQSERGAGR